VHVDITAHFFTCSPFSSSGSRCNQSFYLPGVDLIVDMTAHFSSLLTVNKAVV